MQTATAFVVFAGTWFIFALDACRTNSESEARDGGSKVVLKGVKLSKVSTIVFAIATLYIAVTRTFDAAFYALLLLGLATASYSMWLFSNSVGTQVFGQVGDWHRARRKAGLQALGVTGLLVLFSFVTGHLS